MFLHRAADGRLVSGAPDVLGPYDVYLVSGAIKAEVTDSQIELTTHPCVGRRELLRALESLRAEAAALALERGYLVLPTGTPLLGSVEEQTISRSERYDVIRARFGRLVREQQFSGLHVHVGMHDLDARAAASNALRPWLPVLVALSANSPIWMGEDTGFASWRVVNRVRWPISGPPPVWSSYADYQVHLDELVDLGAAMDPGSIYWDVRLSHRYPTVEARVADTPLTAAEAVLVACLVRAVAASALAGRSVPPIESHVLRSSVFAAARGGLNADIADPFHPHRTAAAPDAVRSLLDFVADELAAYGDREFVVEQVRLVLTRGCGATRQREAVAAGAWTDAVCRHALRPHDVDVLDLSQAGTLATPEAE